MVDFGVELSWERRSRRRRWGNCEGVRTDLYLQMEEA